jgi:hypothetical protein
LVQVLLYGTIPATKRKLSCLCFHYDASELAVYI